MNKYPISDMHLFDLSRDGGSLTLLREKDHLLRRFGQLELLDLSPTEITDFILRAEADRFLFSISGTVTVTMIDLRSTSPTHGGRANISLDSAKPQGLLIPFGVASSLEARGAARLIILSTHSESHPEDRNPSNDELEKYAALQ
jgi:hypothetical protein